MISVPFAALKPFLNSKIKLIPAVSRDIVAKPVVLDAYVAQSDPYAHEDGYGPDASKPQWTVMLSLADVQKLEGDNVRIVPGAFIEAEGSGVTRRPKLQVKSVHPNSEAVWLDCDSTEAV